MSQVFFNSSLPPSQEFFGWRGWVARNILGFGRGKFGREWTNYSPLNQKAIIIDISPGSLMEVAMMVPHLNTVISTGAELFSLMEVKHLDKNGEEVPNSPILKFLLNPNPLQTLEQYLYEFYVLNSVYSKTFQHKISGLSFEKLPQGLWMLPSGWMKINATGKIYRQTDINEIIENFEMLGDDAKDNFEVEKVIYMSEGIGGHILNPVSRIKALEIPLSNIVAALKSRNIITTERGMIGFIAPKPAKSEDGQLPFDKYESERVRKEYQKQYSLDGQGGHVSFTHSPVEWVPMTFDIKQLGLIEGVEDDFSQIIAAYRHDRDLYPSVKGATYENKAAGMKSTIQNALQPLADKLMRQWTKNFIREESGERLEACYDHVPCMKEDERLAAQGKLYKIQGLSIALGDNVISHEQYATVAELEMDGTAEPPQKQPLYAGNQNPKPTGDE